MSPPDGSGPVGASGTGSGGVNCVAQAGFKETGVTDTEVHLGNVSTEGGPIPGFADTAVNGARALSGVEGLNLPSSRC